MVALSCICVPTTIHTMKLHKNVLTDFHCIYRVQEKVDILYQERPERRVRLNIVSNYHHLSRVLSVSFNGLTIPEICGASAKMVPKLQDVVNQVIQKLDKRFQKKYIELDRLFFLPIETFRNCADIAIVSNTGSGLPPLFVQNDNPFLLYYKDLRSQAQKTYPLIVR